MLGCVIAEPGPALATAVIHAGTFNRRKSDQVGFLSSAATFRRSSIQATSRSFTLLQALEALSRCKSPEQDCRSQRIDQEMKVERALHLSPPVGPSIDCASKARTIRS
jgi:hypothetical protein